MSNYVLTIDKNDIKFNEDTQLIIDKRYYNMQLKSVDYNKSVFQPGELKATILVAVDSTQSDDNGNPLTDKVPSYKELNDEFLAKEVKLKFNTFTVAQSYFVFSVQPVFEKNSMNTSVNVVLDIYSWDKLLTLDKYSKTFSLKRLGLDIFPDEMESFKKTYEKYKDYMVTATDMNLLAYGSGKNANEVRQPYLVQYNESFYDFLVRTANRCGEFLYNEDGQLHLGMKVDADTVSADMADKAHRYYLTNATQPGISVQTMHNIFTNHKKSDDALFPEYEVEVKEIKDGQEKTTKKKVAYPAYNDSVAEESYLQPIKKSKSYGDFFKDGFTKEWRKHVVTIFSTILRAPNIYEMAANFLWEEGQTTLKVTTSSLGKSDDYHDKNIKDFEKDDDQTGGENFCQFSTHKDKLKDQKYLGILSSTPESGAEQLTAKYYGIIRELGRRENEGSVCLEFDEDFQNLKIGSKIKVGKDVAGNEAYYVVTNVEGVCKIDESRKYSEQLKVTAVPMLSSTTPFPVTLPEKNIRQSAPQTAYISSNSDPMGLGRVRILYPWQGNKSDASPWIRVTMPMATAGGGFNFLPVKGDEVLINYDGGNIERPYVVGSLYSPYSTSDWGKMEDNSIRSANGHSIVFDTADDCGKFFTKAFFPGFDFIRGFLPAAADKALKVDNPSDPGLHQLSGGLKLSDRYGFYSIAMSTDSREINISSPWGDVWINAFTGIRLMAPNGDITLTGKNIKLEAANTVDIISGKNIEHSFTKAPSSAYDFLAEQAKKKLGEKKLDMKFLRTVMEVFVRPVDGRLKIKAGSFLMLEAGKGNVEIPKKFFKYQKNPLAKGAGNDLDAKTDERIVKGKQFARLLPSINQISPATEGYLNAFIEKFNALVTAINSYEGGAKGEKAGALAIKPIGDIIAEDFNPNTVNFEVDGSMFKKREVPPAPTDEELNNPQNIGSWDLLAQQIEHDGVENYNIEVDNRIARAKAYYARIKQAFGELRTAAQNWRNAEGFDPAGNGQIEGIGNLLKDSIKDENNAEIELNNVKYVKKAIDRQALAQYKPISDKEKVKLQKIARRKVARSFLLATDGKQVSVEENNQQMNVDVNTILIPSQQNLGKFDNEKEWKNYVSSMTEDTSPKIGVGVDLLNYLDKLFVDPFFRAFERSNLWDTQQSRGQILISDEPDITMHINNNELKSDANARMEYSVRLDSRIKALLMKL